MVGLDSRPQVIGSGALGGRGQHDRWTVYGLAGHLGQVEHQLEVPPGLVGSGPISLVDHEQVGDLQEPGLVGLHGVAPPGGDNYHHGVGR